MDVDVVHCVLSLLPLMMIVFFHGNWESSCLEIDGRGSGLEHLVLSLVSRLRRRWGRRIVLILQFSALFGRKIWRILSIVNSKLWQIIVALRHLRNVVIDLLVDAWVPLLVIAHLVLLHKVVLLLAWQLGYLYDVLGVHELIKVEYFQKLVPDFLGEELRILVLLIWVVWILCRVTVLEFGHMPLLKLSHHLIRVLFPEVGKLQFVDLSEYLLGRGSEVRIRV